MKSSASELGLNSKNYFLGIPVKKFLIIPPLQKFVGSSVKLAVIADYYSLRVSGRYAVSKASL